MKVLAERSNAIFFWGPPTIIVCILFFYLRYGLDIRLMPRHYFFCFFISLFLSTLYNLIHRLTLPRILIEYDKAGIYVYNKRRGDPIIIRFEHLWSSISLGREDAYDEDFGHTECSSSLILMEGLELNTGYCSCNSATGTLRLELPNQHITLHGVKAVGQVKLELDRLVRNHKKEKMEFYEDQMMKRQREAELEELRKHDPDT